MSETWLENSKNTVRGLLLHNLPLKALSLLLAALLWHQVSSQQTVQREITIPIEFSNMPLDLEIVNDYVRQVDVVVRSDRGSASIEERQLSAVVDLKAAKAGIEVIQLNANHIGRAKGLEILRINPPQVRLVLENTLTKIVKIEPQIEGEPAAGFQLSDVRVVPSEIVVSGPESQIQRVTTARTGVVDISGASATLNAQSFVELDEPRVRIAESAALSVIAVIEEKRRQVRVPGVAVQILPAEADVRLFDKTIELRGTVPASYEGTLEASKFEVVVDTGPLPPQEDAQQVQPRVSVPKEYLQIFRLEGSRPQLIRVRKAG